MTEQGYSAAANVVVSPITCEPISNTVTDTKNPQIPINSAFNNLSSPTSSASTDFSTTVTKTSNRRSRSIVKTEKTEVLATESRSSRTTAGKTSREWGRASTSAASTSSSTSSTRGRKRCLDSDSDDLDEEGNYKEARQKNNEASRKSRMNKKAKEMEMMNMATQLEKDNRILRMRVEELEKLVTTMRNALLQTALKR